MTAWQASNARLRFSEIVDAAVAGNTAIRRTARRQDGRDRLTRVVRPDQAESQTFLLDGGYSGAGEAAFDESLRDIRAHAPDLLTPR